MQLRHLLLGLGAVLSSVVVSGCASSFDERPRVEIVTPNGIIRKDCDGGAIAFSRDPDRVAVFCLDGSLTILTSAGALIAETPDVFIWEARGVGGQGEHLEAFGFRAGNLVDRSPVLVAMNINRGGVRTVPLPPEYSTPLTEQGAVEDGGACLILSHRTGQLDNDLRFGVFLRVSGPGEPIAFADEPAMIFRGDGYLLSGLARDIGSSVRCFANQGDPRVVVVHRVQTSDAVRYQTAIHDRSGRRVIHDQVGMFRFSNRVNDSQMAMIDSHTSQLAILDVIKGSLDLSRNQEGRRWLDYDVTTHRGVTIQKTEAGVSLLSVDCGSGGQRQICKEEIIEPAIVDDYPYSRMSNTPGSGFIVTFQLPNKPEEFFERWIF